MDAPPHGPGPNPRGFTLIELLAAVTIISILVALLLPAIQSARESARRASCMNNLRQVASALHSYATSHGVFPMGMSMRPSGGLVNPNQSLFVSMLGELDQPVLLNGYNFDRSVMSAANMTLHMTSLASLCCPSDSVISSPTTITDGFPYGPGWTFRAYHASYAACSGTWIHVTSDRALLGRLSSTDNGIAFADSRIGYADIRDGTGQTFAFGERAYGRLPVDDGKGNLVRAYAFWWFLSEPASTQFWTYRPLNSPPADGNYHPSTTYAQGGVASSFHPGGAVFTFVDGSVRFVKDDVDCWPMENPSFNPVGVYCTFENFPKIDPGSRPGVYQALSTRAGSEVIGSDDF